MIINLILNMIIIMIIDRSKGYEQQNRNGEGVWLHPVSEVEVKPKK